MTDREKLEQVRQNLLAQAEDINAFLNQSEELYVRNVQAEVRDSRIFISFDSNGTQEYEVLYSRIGEERIHSLAFNYRNRDLPTLDTGVSIGFSGDDNWQIKIIVPEYFEQVEGRWFTKGETLFESEWVDANKDEGETETPEEKPIFFGMWDSEAVPTKDYQNIYKVYLQGLQEYAQHGKVIPFISGFTKDMSETHIRKRLRDRRSQINRVKDSVEFVLLHDEPFYKGFTPEQQELIIQCAKEEIPGYKFGFSYARGALVDQPHLDRRIPSNLDVAMVNYYPFYQRSYIEKYEWWHMWITTQLEFNNDLENVLSKVKDVPEVWLTGQSHKDDGSQSPKYREPEPETVQWYVDACYKYGLKGVVWWLWESRSRAIGLGEMPELYEEHKRVFKTIPKK